MEGRGFDIMSSRQVYAISGWGIEQLGISFGPISLIAMAMLRGLKKVIFLTRTSLKLNWNFQKGREELSQKTVHGGL